MKLRSVIYACSILALSTTVLPGCTFLENYKIELPLTQKQSPEYKGKYISIENNFTENLIYVVRSIEGVQGEVINIVEFEDGITNYITLKENKTFLVRYIDADGNEGNYEGTWSKNYKNEFVLNYDFNSDRMILQYLEN